MHFKHWYVAIIYDILVKNMYDRTFLTFFTLTLAFFTAEAPSEL